MSSSSSKRTLPLERCHASFTTRSGMYHATVCAKGLFKYFHLPKHVQKLDMVLSRTPMRGALHCKLKYLARARFDGGHEISLYNSFYRQLEAVCNKDNEVWIEVYYD